MRKRDRYTLLRYPKYPNTRVARYLARGVPSNRFDKYTAIGEVIRILNVGPRVNNGIRGTAGISTYHNFRCLIRKPITVEQVIELASVLQLAAVTIMKTQAADMVFAAEAQALAAKAA